jgi:peptidoglycan/xylan/chitin deacetylase (PgdA/CDA1 family)
MSAPFLLLSLDFELLWGVRDHLDQTSYGGNVLGARQAIPRMLDLFAERGVAATWATVGFLFCESRDELLDALPPPEARPVYREPALSAYRYLDEVGADETRDPYYFAPSLIRRIAGTPLQEIGTHTLSHYYCLEPKEGGDPFEADLVAALALARRRGVTIRSIVFPRNQYGPEHLATCRRHGLTAYRGTAPGWAYRTVPGAEQTPLRRALRLLDAHAGPLSPPKTLALAGGPIRNVPASQFLRPCAGRLAALHPLHLRTVRAGMTAAARAGRGYHLWWHPHNFGRDLEANLAGLRNLLDHFERLRGMHGMVSRAMADPLPPAEAA